MGGLYLYTHIRRDSIAAKDKFLFNFIENIFNSIKPSCLYIIHIITFYWYIFCIF